MFEIQVNAQFTQDYRAPAYVQQNLKNAACLISATIYGELHFPPAQQQGFQCIYSCSSVLTNILSRKGMTGTPVLIQISVGTRFHGPHQYMNHLGIIPLYSQAVQKSQNCFKFMFSNTKIRWSLPKYFVFCLVTYETIFKCVLVQHKKNEGMTSFLSQHLPLHFPSSLKCLCHNMLCKVQVCASANFTTNFA